MGDSVTAAPPRRVGPLRRELGAFLALVGLCGIAITEPTFALTGQRSRTLSADGTISSSKAETADPSLSLGPTS